MSGKECMDAVHSVVGDPKWMEDKSLEWIGEVGR